MTDEIKFTSPSGEAGFSFNIFLVHDIYGKGQFTFRGVTADSWNTVMQEAAACVKHMVDQGWKPDEHIPRAVAHEAEKILKEEAATNEAKEVTKGADGRQHGFDYNKPVPADCLPPELDSKFDYYEEHFDQVKIVPEEGDRVTVKFLANGKQYPVGGIMNKWSVEKAAEHLVRLGDLDLTKPKTHDIAGWQYWSYGAAYTDRKTGKAGRYKDCSYVEREL
jgi:hypothetical protein